MAEFSESLGHVIEFKDTGMIVLVIPSHVGTLGIEDRLAKDGSKSPLPVTEIIPKSPYYPHTWRTYIEKDNSEYPETNYGTSSSNKQHSIGRLDTTIYRFHRFVLDDTDIHHLCNLARMAYDLLLNCSAQDQNDPQRNIFRRPKLDWSVLHLIPYCHI